MESCVSLTRHGNHQIDAALEVLHIAEIKRPFVLNRLAHPLVGFFQQVKVFLVFKICIFHVGAASEQLSDNFGSARCALFGQANESCLLVAVTVNTAEIDQAKSVVAHEQVIARMRIGVGRACVIHAEGGKVHSCAKLIS